MRSPIGDMKNVKIFVLYLMQNIGYPLDFVAINDIVMQNDYVMYLDFAEAFHQMADAGLIFENGKNERGEPLYSVTEQGAMVAEQMSGDILPAILDQSLTCALQYLDFQRRGVTLETEITKCPDHSFDVRLHLIEKKKVLFSTVINVDTEYRARQMRETFKNRPEVVYRGLVALLTGKVDFLFQNSAL